MTVSSQVNRKDYSGNGSTTNFATEFRFLEDSHLRVILTVDLTGVETVQSITTNYTVAGKGEDTGGTVTMIIAPATGETLTIKRDVPVTQQTDYVENDDFPAESHERALDKLTMIVQQQQEELDRSLKLSEGQQSSGLTIPVPEENKFMQWDADGNLRNVDIADQGVLAAGTVGKSVLASETETQARDAMSAMGKPSSPVENNISIFDSNGDAKDSLVQITRQADAAGTADVITVAFSPAVTALTNGLEVRVRALLANATTTPTINYNGLGDKVIVKSGNQPLAISDIPGPYFEMQLVYNLGNDNVELLNPAIPAPLVDALAYVIFTMSGTTPVIQSSNNVQTLTRNQTGLYTIVPIVDFPDDEYGWFGVSGKVSANTEARVLQHDDNFTKTTTAFQFSNEGASSGARTETTGVTIYIVR